MRIDELIQKYIKLRPGTDNDILKSRCPFCKESGETFLVDKAKDTFFCYSCGKGGNPEAFCMDYLGMTFDEAKETVTGENAKANKSVSFERDQLLQINRDCGNIFYLSLRAKNAETKKAYDYAKENRALTDETLKKFAIGYAPKKSNLYEELKGRGHSDEILKRSMLFNDKNQSKFFDRLMFPIMDENGSPVGFGGRVLGDGTPKYLNSSESELFTKRHHLYGLNFAKDTKENYFLMCEGYMDVIAMHQAGFDNAVATLGTAVTSDHAKLIKKYKNEVVLCYDSDEAGINAAKKAILVLEEQGVSCRVLSMEPYKDPDEYIKNLGRKLFQRKIDEAMPSQMFYQKHLSNFSKEKEKEDKEKYLALLSRYF